MPNPLPASSEVPSPDVEPTSMDQVYADARATATHYPVLRPPKSRASDNLTAEEHWRDICSDLTSHDSLSRQVLE